MSEASYEDLEDRHRDWVDADDWSSVPDKDESPRVVTRRAIDRYSHLAAWELRTLRRGFMEQIREARQDSGMDDPETEWPELDATFARWRMERMVAVCTLLLTCRHWGWDPSGIVGATQLPHYVETADRILRRDSRAEKSAIDVFKAVGEAHNHSNPGEAVRKAFSRAGFGGRPKPKKRREELEVFCATALRLIKFHE